MGGNGLVRHSGSNRNGLTESGWICHFGLGWIGRVEYGVARRSGLARNGAVWLVVLEWDVAA